MVKVFLVNVISVPINIILRCFTYPTCKHLPFIWCCIPYQQSRYPSTHNGFVIIKALVKLVDGIEKLNDLFTQFLIIMRCLQARTKFIDAIADNIIQVALVSVPAEGIIIVNDAFDDELVDASGIVVVLLLDIIIGDGFDA